MSTTIMDTGTLFLGEKAVRELLHMAELIPAMEAALQDLSSGKVVQPVRTVVPVAEHGGFFAVMPAYGSAIGAASDRAKDTDLGGAFGGALGAKLVTFYPNNQGIPTHHAMVLLFKPEKGEPLAIMDGRLITEMRTAAVSAVATRYLARPEAAVLAILGSGVQAGSHLESLRLVRDFREVRVWSPRNARAFVEAHAIATHRTPGTHGTGGAGGAGGTGRTGGTSGTASVYAVASAEEAICGADVVVVATSAQSPVLLGEWLSPGTHINAIGATRPNWRELDDATLVRSRIFVESRAAATVESGDVIAAGTLRGWTVDAVKGFDDLAEIGEVIAGLRSGRETDQDITLFKSVGVAVEDVVAADLVFRKAMQGGYTQAGM